MKIENGKIVEATIDELYEHWIKDDWAEMMSFLEYKWRYKDAGGVILDDDDHHAVV